MIPWILGGGAAIVVLFAADWLAEDDIRERQKKIRKTKGKLMAAEAELKHLAYQKSLERGRREYMRRKALLAYRNAQRELILISLDALKDAKAAAFTKLRIVKDRIAGRNGMARAYLDKRLFDRFRQLENQVHEAIAESKTITSYLYEQLDKVQAEIDSLTDASTHKRLGSKRKIEELLEQLHAEGRRILASRDARGTVLFLGNQGFVLEKMCTGCRAWLSPTMTYCPSCGQEQAEVDQKIYLKRDSGEGPTCPDCLAPTSPELRHCFNCGEIQDPFGLRAAM